MPIQIKCTFKYLLTCLLIAQLSFVAFAAIDIYQFDTESQRQRYHVLVDELRCPKCQNQNLAGSDSQIAADLRRELHRLLLEGQTDSEIKDFMVARYGDFVLYKPPFQSSTMVLWLLPMLLILAGIAVLILVIRRRRQALMMSEHTLSTEDLSTLNNILDDSNKTSGEK